MIQKRIKHDIFLITANSKTRALNHSRGLPLLIENNSLTHTVQF